MDVKVKQDMTKTSPYPKLMISNKGTIVLFSRKSVGVCLSSTVTGNKAGDYSKTWSMEFFEDFYGEVILSN